MTVDLRNATISQFVAAIFDPTSATPGADDGPGFMLEPQRQLALVTQLFRQSQALLAHLSDEQIVRGLWKLFIESELLIDLLWNRSLPGATRVAAIQSVANLYADLLAREPFDPVDFSAPDRFPRPFETIDYMLTDLVSRAPHTIDITDADALHVRDAIVATLGELLRHPAPIAQFAALHGLGHLRHGAGADLIDAYLCDRPDLDSSQREYAAAARRGEVL